MADESADRNLDEAKTPGATTDPNEAEENLLLKKLGWRSGMRTAVIGAPEGDDNPLAPVPADAGTYAQVDDLGAEQIQFDYIHVFAHNRAELTRKFSMLRNRLAPGGSLWISWLRQSSGRRGGGLPADLNENIVRRMALSAGLVDVKVTALTQEWAALKLAHRKH